VRPRAIAIPILAALAIACLPAASWRGLPAACWRGLPAACWRGLPAVTFVAAAAQSKSAPAQSKPDPKTLKSARNFVDHFYGLYLTELVDDDDNPSPYDAVESQGRLFNPILRKELKDYFDAPDDSDEISGLDFDPFLYSQDPCQEYEVGDAAMRRAAIWVPVYGVCDGKKHEKPDLYAEVAPAKSGWQFVNFHYPNGGNLLAILKSLRVPRRKSPRAAVGTSRS